MGVYIRGMEMPKEGNWKTVRIYPDGTCAVPNWQGDCTLIKGAQAFPVPDHGRLIDADALRCLYDPHDYGLDGEQADEYDRYHVSLPVIRQNIDDMPTIIPADKEGGE